MVKFISTHQFFQTFKFVKGNAFGELVKYYEYLIHFFYIYSKITMVWFEKKKKVSSKTIKNCSAEKPLSDSLSLALFLTWPINLSVPRGEPPPWSIPFLAKPTSPTSLSG